MTMDKDRRTLYALSSKGFIHAFDMDSNPKSTSSSSSSTMGGLGGVDHMSKLYPPKLTCSVDVVKSVRKYLDFVSHGRMYPPSHSGLDYTIASISFPGGGAGAKAGVGSMEGARMILKTADAEIMRNKSRSQGRRMNGVRSRPGMMRGGASASAARTMGEGCLHPISIHVVPSAESKFLTLVAVSSGDLRYYLSVLPDAGTGYGVSLTKPGRRFSLCHVRAPPPFIVNPDRDVTLDNKLQKLTGTVPNMENRREDSKGRVTKSCYMSGMTLLSVDCGYDPIEEHTGCSMLAITPDYTKNIDIQASVMQQQQQQGNSLIALPGSSSENGVNEIVSQPVVANRMNNVGVSVLPGGHVWEINTKCLDLAENNPVMNLFTKSTTPSSFSQSDKIPAAFLPPSERRMKMSKKGLLFNSKTPSKTSLDTATKMSKALTVSSSGITGLLRSFLTGTRGTMSGPPTMKQ